MNDKTRTILWLLAAAILAIPALSLAAVLAPELMRSAHAQSDEISNEVIERAETLAGLQFS